jgi:predicted ATP-dependent protease
LRTWPSNTRCSRFDGQRVGQVNGLSVIDLGDYTFGRPIRITASAELYALLSDLAGVPLRQDIAVTGSVNQHGELQAIGGVNEKIEGFHRACKLRELTGRQGVIIPQSNVPNLMLSHEVVDSVRAGRFHIWSARTVDEGIELLTGMPAGERGTDGSSLQGSLHARVEERLERWARLADKERLTHDEDLRTS